MGKNMEFKYKKKKDGGEWIIILGCPLIEKHTIADDAQDISGPSFVDCTSCEHQVGTGYAILGSDGEYDGATVFPERLKCGYAIK